VFDRDMQATLTGGLDTEVLQLPEQAGGEPVPTGASTVGANQPDPDTLATQAAPEPVQTAQRSRKAPNDPGASQGLPMTTIDAKAAVGRGDYEVARDLARSIGGEAAVMEIDYLISERDAGGAGARGEQ
jgi:hypothetical protein